MPTLPELSPLAIVAAGGVSFFVGFVWYTLLFSKPWMTAMGIKLEDVESSGLSSKSAIAASLLTSVATAAGLAVVFVMLGRGDLGTRLAIAGIVWVGFSLAPLVKMIFWEDRKVTLVAIDGGYELASIVAATLVWHAMT